MKVGETYLGDGLYARYDGFALWLRAPRETGDHFVALEPREFRALLEFAATNEDLGAILRGVAMRSKHSEQKP